ncbi:ABC transporter permease [Faecalimonas sp.]
MKILNELTIKNLKRNKRRTFVTIFGVLLSVALITAITTFVSSMQGSLIEYAKKTNGNYHMLVRNVPKEKQKYLLHNEKAKKKMVLQTIENVKTVLKDDDENFPKTKIFGMKKEEFADWGIVLQKGKLPQNKNEILLSLEFQQNYLKKLDVQDTLKLEIEGKEKEYVISGIVKTDPLNFYNEQDRGYNLFTMFDEERNSGNLDIAMLMKKPKDTFAVQTLLEKELDLHECKINDTLLTFQGAMRNIDALRSLKIMAGIVIGIILFTSVFVIKNSFDISVTERLKQYGMLASVGATSKQIRKNVLFEGAILGMISIPLGVLFGIGAIGLTLRIVMEILKGISFAGEIELKLYVSVVSILIAVVVAICMIYISSLIPAKSAQKVSPMESIRETKSTKLEAKKLRTSKLFSKIFGIEGEIAQKNLKRSRKKYRTTVFSLFISIVLFLSISSIKIYGEEVQNLNYGKIEYNLIAYNDEQDIKKKEEIYQKASKVKGINKCDIVKMWIASPNNVSLTETAEKVRDIAELSQEEKDEEIQYVFYSFSNKTYKKFVKKLGISYEEVKDKGILYDTSISFVRNEGERKAKRKKYHELAVKEGEKLRFDGGEIEIVKRSDRLPVIQNSNNIPSIIVSEEWMNKRKFSYTGIYIDANNTLEVREEMEAITGKEGWTYRDFEEEARENNSINLIMSIFLYGFLIVISVIGITNIFNTITTNMALRSREFAALRSVGMTDKEFKKMIWYESFFYGTKALLYGIPVGVMFSYIFYKQFVNILEIPYYVPYRQICICILVVFLVVCMTMGYSVKKVKKQNIIETIRSENI